MPPLTGITFSDWPSSNDWPQPPTSPRNDGHGGRRPAAAWWASIARTAAGPFLVAAALLTASTLFPAPAHAISPAECASPDFSPRGEPRLKVSM